MCEMDWRTLQLYPKVMTSIGCNIILNMVLQKEKTSNNTCPNSCEKFCLDVFFPWGGVDFKLPSFKPFRRLNVASLVNTILFTNMGSLFYAFAAILRILGPKISSCLSTVINLSRPVYMDAILIMALQYSIIKNFSA